MHRSSIPGGWRGGGKAGKAAVSKPSNKLNPISPYAYEHEEIKAGVRELLLRMEPLVKVSGGSAPLESMMTYLEELDDASFEKYQLVKHIKSKLKTSLLHLVQAEVQLQCKDTLLTPEKMKIVAPAILSKLMTSSEMEECLDGLHTEVGDAASEMCTNFDRELVLMAQLRDSQLERPLTRNSSSLSDSLSSTWNQSGFVFIQPNQYAKLADKLNQYKTVEERMDALNMLLASQVSECVGSQYWSSIKEGLQAALVDLNPAVFGTALRVFSRLLANVTPFCTKEAFVSLTSSVVALYKDKTRSYQLPAVATEISFKKRPNYNLLQVCRLIVMTCKELPKYWTRYPAAYIEEIMRAMLEMSTLKSRGQKGLSPIHLVSLVDPKALWLKAWLHGNIGRQMFFSLSESTHDHLFFKTGIHHLLVTLDKDTFPLLSRSSGRKKGLISSSLVSFAFFSHNLNVSCFALKFCQGQKMFPISLPSREDPIDPLSIMKSLVHFVSHGHQLSHQTSSKMITRALVSTVGQSDLNIMKYWINEKVADMLIAPLINYQRNQHTTVAINLCQLVEVLLRSQIGMTFARNVNIEASKMSLPDFVLEFTLQFVKSLSTMTHQSELLLLSAVRACKPIVKSYFCVTSHSFEAFVHALANALFELDDLSAVTPTNSMANLRIESQASEMKSEILQILGMAASTPRGLFVVSGQDGLLQTLVQDGGLSLASTVLSVFSANGKFALEENAFIETSKKKVMKIINEQETAKMWQPPPNTYEENVRKIMVNLVTLMAELDNFEAHLKAVEEILPLDKPLNFATEMDSFTLRFFECLISDLDVRVRFMARYDLDAILLELAANCKNEEGTIMMDSNANCIVNMQESLLRGIGGPSERNLILNDQKVEEMRLLKPTEARDLVVHVKEHKADSHAKELFKKYAKEYELSEEATGEILLALLALDQASLSPPGLSMTLNREEELSIELFARYQSYSDELKNTATELMLFHKTHDQDEDHKQNWNVLILNSIFKGNLPKIMSIMRPQNATFVQGDDLYLLSKVGHLVELILDEEFPMIIPVLKSVNISVSFLVRRWIRQNFLNIIDWSQVLNFLLIQAIFGRDYAVYFCVAMFRLLQGKILDAHPDNVRLLLCDPIRGNIGDLIPVMEHLEHIYRPIVNDFLK